MELFWGDIVYYIPFGPLTCMLMGIIGTGIWVHYTAYMYNQVNWALEILGPTVTAPNLGRIHEAIIATATVYMIFAFLNFVVGLWRKVIQVKQDLEGYDAKTGNIYRIVVLLLGFSWWIQVVWLVLLLMGCGIFAVDTYVAYRLIEKVQLNQAAMAPVYNAWVTGVATGWTVSSSALAAAGGDLIVAVGDGNGWPRAVTCPSTCLNLATFPIVEVDPDQACVCDAVTLAHANEALDNALSATAGMFVGLWFMWVFGDFFKTILTADFVRSDFEAKVQERAGAGGGGGGGGAMGGAGGKSFGARGGASFGGRGYNKL
ncbi:hypothetical protein HYH02_005900 [Chlamydomonas schloesseri]|uniref:Uncharacterized protein n=1 Tax=Chlamydomonas schloesseri TaxID=2026947 RepID=A0A836B6T8_9CHLO|nr:hypothetical protein HYH02_005900 [Chlamydomonas schloesseri]|eukprot:KAG2449153.1 hypothetical protein HYH02_005900 [Chlamydomonas schloesseri]